MKKNAVVFGGIVLLLLTLAGLTASPTRAEDPVDSTPSPTPTSGSAATTTPVYTPVPENTTVVILTPTPTPTPTSDCDASIEVVVTTTCLDRDTGSGSGTLTVRNSGEQGESTVALEAVLTKGSGTVDPASVTLTLGPGAEKMVDFTVTINETPEQLEDGAQVEWTVTDESCRPDHNVGKRDRVDFPWCPPTAVVLGGFTASSPPPASEGESISSLEMLLASFGSLVLAVVVVGGLWYLLRRLFRGRSG